MLIIISMGRKIPKLTDERLDLSGPALNSAGAESDGQERQ
jgi:hypothetical protein